MITCDPNLRLNLWKTPEEAKEQMNWALRQADVVKISDEEVEFLWGLTPEEGADHLLNECGVSLAMVTLGPKGCFLKNRTAEARVNSPKVHPIDTTGAGDIFGGSAVSRILEIGKNPADLNAEELKDVGSFASTSASLSTEFSGGIPSIRDRETILKRIQG